MGKKRKNNRKLPEANRGFDPSSPGEERPSARPKRRQREKIEKIHSHQKFGKVTVDDMAEIWEMVQGFPVPDVQFPFPGTDFDTKEMMGVPLKIYRIEREQIYRIERDLPLIGQRDHKSGNTRLEGDIIDEFCDGAEIQLRIFVPPLHHRKNEPDEKHVVLLSNDDMADLYDGTFLIKMEALKAYEIL